MLVSNGLDADRNKFDHFLINKAMPNFFFIFLSPPTPKKYKQIKKKMGWKTFHPNFF